MTDHNPISRRAFGGSILALGALAASRTMAAPIVTAESPMGPFYPTGYAGTESDDAKTHDAHAQWAADMERVYGLAELIVAKQRHGSTGKVRLRFEPRITKFSDLAEDALGASRYD